MKFSSSCTAASALTLALASTSLSMSHAQLSTPVLMHYMPWFTLERQNTHWSMQLKERDGLYLMERYQQTGRVAAHYTPLIGPYSSKDEDTIRLHLELLRQAGVKGVIINWYGISNRNDYPVLKEAADTIIRLSNTAGMLWTLCYEDRTIDKNLSEEDQKAQLQADWEYIRDAYIGQFSGTMLRDAVNERPVFLQFGPETFDQPSTWVNMLNTVFSDISERPYLLGVDKVNPQNALPDGGFNWPGWDLFENSDSTHLIKTFHTSFYDRAQGAGWYPVVGSTFPRFRDYYVQGNPPNAEPESWWNVNVPSFDGDTVAVSIDAARERGADLLQAVTWNDWQEGTTFEPSAEEGYTQLLRLQEHILGRVDEDSMRNAVLAYNDVKASEWQRCGRVPPDQKLDCGTADSTEVSCEASGCCWRPSSQPGPWCFQKVPSPGICERPAPAVRNCTRTPEDRLCHCQSAIVSLAPASTARASASGSPTSGPTTIFDGQNYTIQAPDVTFQDANGQFKLDFLYKVGASADDLRFSLFRTGCENSNVTNIIYDTTWQTVDNSVYSKEVSINKTKIEGSPLVAPAGGLKGFSAGSLNFCVKAEALEEAPEGTISVSFLKTEVSLTYDLTDNSFSVENNNIKADAIGNKTSTIDVNYGVGACRCSKEAFACISGPSNPSPVLTQNELIYICLSPNDESKDDVDISNFKMNFVQNERVVYRAAEIGSSGEPTEGSLSQISSSEQTYKVTSRVVTEIFEGGPSFNVTGVAYLEFKSRRLLASVGKQGLRGIQGLDTSETEAPFSLNLEIKKTKERAGNDVARGNLSVTLTAAVAAVVLALVFVIRKKLA